MNKSFATLAARFPWLKWVLLGIPTVAAVAGLCWSCWPIPEVTYPVSIPSEFTPDSESKYAFPETMQLMLTFPAYLRYGDTQSITAEIRTGDTQQTAEDTCDLCAIKHGLPFDLWDTYHVNIFFAFDQNNLLRQPQGDTTISMTKGLNQQFRWQVRAVNNEEAYCKTTIYLEMISLVSGNTQRIPFFANEHTIPVKALWRIKTPLIRVLSGIWLLSLVFFTLITKLSKR